MPRALCLSWTISPGSLRDIEVALPGQLRDRPAVVAGGGRSLQRWLMPSLPQEQQRGSWGSKTLSVTALDVMGEHEATTGWVVGAVESWD